MDDKESLILAEDVVDLQVEYSDTDGWHSAATGPWSTVQMVRLTVLLQEARTRWATKVPACRCWPIALTMAASKDGCSCGYVYRTYRVEINPRNVGL